MRTVSIRRRSLTSVLVGLLLAPPAVWAGPSGETVVRGNVTVNRDGVETTITAGNRSIIEWDNFNIGAEESVRFIQPNRRARVLNRVVGPDATYIEGQLRANGTVYLLNKFGIFLGNSAVVEVAHLLAGAGNLSNEDFASGIERFTELGGAVENFGQISGSSVTLLGKSIANHGSISATNGRIWMLAGDEVIIAEHGSPIILRIGTGAESDLANYAITNAGNIDAGNRGSVRMAAGDLLSLAIHNSGAIHAREIRLAGGENSRVQVGGTLDASNTLGGPNRDGGSVDIRGDYVFVDDATIDASGRRGGGSVHIGGAVAGGLEPGSLERNSQLTYISDDSIVRADALLTGDGGEVVAWSDGATFVDGQLSARGADRSGDGGFAETSGKTYLSADVVPDLSAPNGDGGMWLIDPANITIVPALTVPLGGDQDLSSLIGELSTSVQTSGSPSFLPLANSSEITADTLEAALGRGFNITISTELTGGASGTGEEGNIVFEEGLNFDSPNTILPGTTAALTLLAANRIEVEAGSGGIDDTTSPNLSLALFFRAGDTSQPHKANSEFDAQGAVGTTPGANESIELKAAIRVRGPLDLSGEDVIAESTLTAASITINGRHAVSTRNLATTGGDINIRSQSGHIGIVGFGSATPDIQTEGGGVLISALGGDVDIEGTVDLRADITDTAPDAPGGSLQIDAVPQAVFNPPTDLGGDIRLTEIAATDTITAPGGLFLNAGVDMSVEQDVVANGANVTFRITDNSKLANIVDDDGNLLADQDFITGDQTLAILGNVTTNGGDITLEATQAIDDDLDVDMRIAGNLDARDPDPASFHGNVIVSPSGAVDVANNVVLSGDNVQLSAGLDGSGDLTFEGTATINARAAAVEAGDGYSALPAGGLVGQELTDFDLAFRSSTTAGLASVTMQGNSNDDLEAVLVLQDADFATGSLPTIDYGTTAEPVLQLNARDGGIHVEAASLSALPTSLQLSLLAAGGDGATPFQLGQAFQLDQELDFDRVDLSTTGTLVVDSVLADMASGISTNELHITAGRGGIIPTDPGRQPNFAGVPGGLMIEDGVALVAKEVLELRGAANGVGDFLSAERDGRGVQVGDAVTLEANDITLRAGDGPGGANFVRDDSGATIFPRITNKTGGSIADPTTNLSIQNFDTTPLSFTYEQEASIGVNDLPAVSDADSEVHYTAISDEGQIAIGDITVPVLQDKDVTLVARDYDFSLLTSPITTRKLDIGGITSFQVDNALLSNFNWGSNDLTLRAATGLNSGGELSFANGTIVSADTIRLVASDGLGIRNTAAIDVNGATFTAANNATVGPNNFIMEQDADLTSGDLPDAASFGDGNDLPGTLALRSVDSSVLLDEAPTIFQNRLLLAGPLVSISVEDQNLDLASIPDLEIRADQILLRAASKNDTDGLDYAVVFDTASANATNKFFGYDDLDGGSEDGDLNLTARSLLNSPAPEVFTVQQDSDILSSELPDRADFGADGPEVNGGTLYRLHADQDASINVDDAARVKDASLELRLLNYDDDDAAVLPTAPNKRKVELGSTNTYVLQGLDISVPESLTLTDIDIDAIGLVRLEAGTRGDPNGNLVFQVSGANPDNTIRATEILLLAGSSISSAIDTKADGSELAKIEIGSGTLDLTLDADDPLLRTGLTLEQDANLSTSALLPNGFSVDPAVTNLDFLDLVSRRGKLSVDIGDVLNTETMFLSAGTHSVTFDGELTNTGPDVVGTLEVFAPAGDLDLGVGATSHMTDISLSGRHIELRAESAGSRLNIHSETVRAAGGSATLPVSVLISQDAAFDFADNSGLAEPFSNVLLADQFADSARGLDYQLESRSEDFTVNDLMAAQLASFDLTLDNKTNAIGGAHRITLDPSLATSQVFFGLHAVTSDVFIDTPAFSTLSIQSYDAPVTFMRSSSLLSGADLLFANTVQASNALIDVSLFAGRRVQLAGGVGSSGGLSKLVVGNQLHDLNVFFLDRGELEFGSTAAPTADAFAVGELQESFTNTSDTGVYLQGNLKVHAINSLKLASTGALDPTTVVPISRKPGSSVATIYKRGIGKLQIDAHDVSFGTLPTPDLANGEKLTVLGTLDINASGDVVVGDLTANRIEIDANSISVLKRRGTSVRGPNGSIERDGGVDWVANTFALTTLLGNEAINQVGPGRRLIIGTSGPRPNINGVLIDAPVFAVKPNLGPLPASDLIYDPDGVADPTDTSFNVAPAILDGKPRGPSSADLSNSFSEESPVPTTNAPLGDRVVEADAFSEIGITTRSATGREYAARANNRGIFDDASHAWRSDREVAALTSARLDVPNASEARRLFLELFGTHMGKAAAIRAVLEKAVADYQAHTGVRRVLGFELRRYLKNRPSTQFDAYQILEQLDQLFSSHRRSGLVPGEYAPVQRAWVEAITPEGIAPDELGEAIQPSRYVRGSDVLDIFGE